MKKVLALVVSSVVLLSGCAAGSPQTAAVVGNSSVSVSVVEGIVRGYEATLKAQPIPPEARERGQKEIRAKVLMSLVVGNSALQFANEHGISVTPEDLKAAISQDPAAAQMAQNPAIYPYVEAWATPNVVLRKFGDKDKFVQEVLSRKVQVNPRYGNLDLSKELTEESLIGSLSVVAPK